MGELRNYYRRYRDSRLGSKISIFQMNENLVNVPDPRVPPVKLVALEEVIFVYGRPDVGLD